ncbi:MAG: sulfatase-like hydrolase/transferase [Acidobacteria bacterium]|nr:sulfatase-like hydrolase/transferase [Acidobacteriota bacterium]
MLTRRTFASSLLAAPLAAPLMNAQSTRRPNLVILYADDMGHHDVSFNGRKEWSTPNLDRLGAQGTVFDRWYSAYPLCAPSRAALLTGKYGIHNTVRNNVTDIPKDEVTLAEAVKPLGYSTALFGKWHQGKLAKPNERGETFTHPLEQGFDETFGYLDALHAWEHFPKALWRNRTSEPVSGYSCDLLANEAVRFINQKKADPFLLYVPFIEPHFWVEAPEENLKKYRGKFPEKDPSKPVRAAYAAMIERLDSAIGRIVKTIDDAGLGKDTVILFSSDNGATFEERTFGAPWHHDSNQPFRGQKRSLEEGGIRVPGIVRWTGQVPAGKRSSEVMHMTDVMPSMLQAAGGRPESGWKVDGTNMLDVWRGKAKAPDRTVFWEFTVEGWHMLAAMRGDWKYLEMGENRWLYNVKDDPQERRTLAGEYPEVFKQLQAETRAWLATARQS